MTSAIPPGLEPAAVHDVLGRHLLTDGFDFVLDLTTSRGSELVDQRDGSRYLDLFTFFASSALGMNHPGLVDDPEFLAELTQAAINKPSNSDIYTVAMAEFVDTFARVLGDPELPHLFFVEGGGLAVENALKVAFDWKSRRNEAVGKSPELGTKIMHLTGAFHGRTGYTMSLTNTDPNKVARFPKFDWPRVPAPFVSEHHDVAELERDALAQAAAHFEVDGDDIAAFICEPIQGEGGDRHLRPEFLLAMKQLCLDHDALLIFDEVQTGCGLTGSPWAYQKLGVQPDVVSFGKKLQVCGIMAGGRVDEVADNVFAVPSRINSTWGGNLTDMVRARRILQIIESEKLINNAEERGVELLQQLRDLSAAYPQLSDPRGQGLMCAVTLSSVELRDQVVERMRTDEHVFLLGCGESSIRFRPALTVSADLISHAVQALGRVLHNLT